MISLHSVFVKVTELISTILNQISVITLLLIDFELVSIDSYVQESKFLFFIAIKIICF